MAAISTPKLPNVGRTISTRQPFRKTRNSVVSGELKSPYPATRLVAWNSGLAHNFVLFESATDWVSCCRMRLSIKVIDVGTPNCLDCIQCRGCAACNPNHVCDATMRLGKWETMDGRRLYPFEMDNTHLQNAIAKLRRDKHHFKDNYLDWIDILETEAGLRGLIPRVR